MEQGRGRKRERTRAGQSAFSDRGCHRESHWCVESSWASLCTLRESVSLGVPLRSNLSYFSRTPPSNREFVGEFVHPQRKFCYFSRTPPFNEAVLLHCKRGFGARACRTTTQMLIVVSFLACPSCTACCAMWRTWNLQVRIAAGIARAFSGLDSPPRAHTRPPHARFPTAPQP